jgi:hypothetical protein
MSDNTPGWQPDPSGKHDHRYWDGTQWTENVADAGVAGVDPYEAAAPEPEVPAEAEAPVQPEAPAGLDEPTVVDQQPAAPDATEAYPTTVEQPAAWGTPDPATGAPAPPPPYVPTEPGDGGGSKRGLLIGGGILAAVAIAVIAFLALGGDDDDDSSVQAQLASKLEEEADGDLTSEQADCVAGLLVDEAGEDAFEGVDYNAEEPPPELLDAFLAVGLQTMADECGIDEETLDGTDGTTDSTDDTTDDTTGGEGSYGSDPDLDELWDACEEGDFAACDQLYLDSPGGSEYEAFGDTCGDRNEPSGFCVDLYEVDDGGTEGLTDGIDSPADFEQQLADTYESMLGLGSEQAECLASKLADVVDEGTIDESEAMTEVMSYLADCDISIGDISAN